jgi:membrane-associated phospholipid phosphatase
LVYTLLVLNFLTGVSPMIRYVVVVLLLCCQVSLGQTYSGALSDSLNLDNTARNHPVADSILPPETLLLRQQPSTFLPVSHISGPNRGRPGSYLVVPAILLGAGFLTLDNPEYLESNEALQRKITWHYPGFHSGLDNYTRYVPLAAVYGLNLAGVKGKNDLVSLTMIFAISSFINNTISGNLKHLTQEKRPDDPGFDAFPSWHTSTAFANAEIMHQEYQQQSAWYSLGGYSFAVATGTLRMLNNRHWLSDVVAGAGVGMLSTRLAYLIYPWLKENIHLGHQTKYKVTVAPIYQQGSYGLSMGLPVNAKSAARKKTSGIPYHKIP